MVDVPTVFRYRFAPTTILLSQRARRVLRNTGVSNADGLLNSNRRPFVPVVDQRS